MLNVPAAVSTAGCETVVYSDAILQAVHSTPQGAEMVPVELPEAFYQDAGEQARKQIIRAGVRLGGVLKKLSTSKAASDSSTTVGTR